MSDAIDVHDLLLSRRSVRRFTPQPVPEDDLRRMVDTARLAPTGANLQPLRFLVVTDPERRARVFETLKWAAYIAPAGNPPEGHEPTAYIVILKDERIQAPSYKYDIGFAAENILIAGLARGVAGCVLLSFNPKHISEAFSLPEYLRPDMVVALGYPDEFPVYTDRDDTVKYWRDENNVHIVPKLPLDQVMFVNTVED